MKLDRRSMGLTRTPRTTQEEALEARRTVMEIMRHGSYLIADHNGLWVCRGSHVPWELRMRVAALSVPIIEALIGDV